jgi:hypothetical protein
VEDIWDVQETNEATSLLKLLYNQRNKDETILSVIKRLFGDHITSRLVRTQNRDLSLRCIAYNTHRLTNLIKIIYVFYIADELKDISIWKWQSFDNSISVKASLGRI